VLTKEGHLQQAAHNEKFIHQFDLDNTEFLDWAVIAAFYAALHWINAYLVTQNFKPANHETRDKAIVMYSVTKKIAWEYTVLKQHGFNARYRGFRFTAKQVRDQVIPFLEAIKKQILQNV
jgi:uncharacterized protein (UPF0332 family)